MINPYTKEFNTTMTASIKSIAKDAQLVPAVRLASTGLLLLTLLIVGADGDLHFLQKCLDAADKGSSIKFPEVITFFDNLRGGLVGIALPVGTCALVAGCVLWAFGQLANRMAKALLGGGLVAAVGVLLVPGLLA